MVELADTLDSKSSAGDSVPDRGRPGVPNLLLMRECWNWQTGYVEIVVSEKTCGIVTRLAYQIVVHVNSGLMFTIGGAYKYHILCPP